LQWSHWPFASKVIFESVVSMTQFVQIWYGRELM